VVTASGQKLLTQSPQLSFGSHGVRVSLPERIMRDLS
jgi:hypothetical protein